MRHRCNSTPIFCLLYLLIVGGNLLCTPAARAESPPDLAHRWVYLATNLALDKNVDDAVTLLERAARAGYNGLVLHDSKFLRWDKVEPDYLAKCDRVREVCRRLRMELVVCVFPIGYANNLLSVNPNLAEGYPVVKAPFIVRGGRLYPAPEPAATVLNGGFEEAAGDQPTGWRFVDHPGKICFIDRQVTHSGQASLRMQDIARQDPQHGNARAHQKIKVRPFAQYHLSAWVKTQDFNAASEVRLTILDQNGQRLCYVTPVIAPTQDWQRIDLALNTLANSEIGLYAGVWCGQNGTLWWDDVRIEPAGLVNVLRRAGTPLLLQDESGSVTYSEGTDVEPIGDPKLGNDPYPGEYTVWHAPPAPRILPGGRLREGQLVRISYYHSALIYREQVMCCLAEPEVYEILHWQAEKVKEHLQPDGYFMQHDEIRCQGWDLSCERSGKTTSQLLVDNVRRCTGILRRTDPGKPIYVWSDMFDPFHNAAADGPFYLVKGTGPWHGSWTGLDPDITMVNWHTHEPERAASFRHFAERGHAQILAGYYDGDPQAIKPWLAQARASHGLTGVMYTTWRHEYRDLEAFAAAAGFPVPPK